MKVFGGGISAYERPRNQKYVSLTASTPVAKPPKLDGPLFHLLGCLLGRTCSRECENAGTGKGARVDMKAWRRGKYRTKEQTQHKADKNAKKHASILLPEKVTDVKKNKKENAKFD